MPKMFDDIVIFAHNYPYWCGPTAETYLEEEISILSQQSARVVVVAFEGFWQAGGTLRANLPSNLEVIQLLEPSLQSEPDNRKRRIDQLKRTFSLEFASDAHQLKTRAHARTFHRFNELGDQIYAAALKGLLDLDPHFGSGKTLIYSFWFNEPARATVLLRDKLVALSGHRPVAIARAHGYDCYGYRNELDYLPCQEWLAQRLDRVFPCSQDGVDYLRKRNPKASGKFEVAHLGTRSISHKGGVSTNRDSNIPTILTCSRIVPLKRLDRVARAVELLKRAGTECKWICIGDGVELQALKDLTGSLGVSGDVQFTGALTQDQISTLYSSAPADVFVLPSEYEGIPLAIMEAMSVGIPVVATRVGGVPEIVHDGVNGILVDRDFTDEDLARAIKFFIEKPRPDYAAAALSTWENQFSSSANAMKMLNICDNIWANINVNPATTDV